MKIITQFYIIIMVVFMGSCTAPPDQPSLSTKERVFFRQLNKRCNCNIEREVDWKLLRVVDKNQNGNYFLRFRISCNQLKKDSLEKYSDILSKILYIKILDKDIKYNEITIGFECNTGVDQYKSTAFDYSVDKLLR